MSRVRHVGEFYESELKEAWVKHELGVADVVYQNCWTGEYSSGVPPDTHVVMTPQQYQLEKVSFGALGTSNALFKKPRIGRRQPSAGASRAARVLKMYGSACSCSWPHAVDFKLDFPGVLPPVPLFHGGGGGGGGASGGGATVQWDAVDAAVRAGFDETMASLEGGWGGGGDDGGDEGVSDDIGVGGGTARDRCCKQRL
jgi:hypothetical protein